MIDLKHDFKTSTLEEWKEQLAKELKGDQFEKLLRNDQIEELAYPTFHHAESAEIKAQIPGIFPYTRGLKTTDNNWSNGVSINVTDAKEANKTALDLLMKGCDFLYFDLVNYQGSQWSQLIEGIEFEYITTFFNVQSAAQLNELVTLFQSRPKAVIRFGIDIHSNADLFSSIEPNSIQLNGRQLPFAYVDGYSLQQTGATTWQEIAFCLSTGHEYLVRLMDRELTVDQAAACIHFSIGIGSNYFYEIAKTRVLKQLWATIIRQYEPEHTCTYNCSITAQIGFMNKSLADPYTNLLRQTTEAMSASIGGVDAMIVHPYDACSNEGISSLSQRMALNISLILKEESYFNYVTDPMGGSYAIESITSMIAEKAWDLFKSMEETGGICDSVTLSKLKTAIILKAQQRLESITSKEQTLIGINKFPNFKVEEGTFKNPSTYLGLNQLIFERDLKKA